MKRIAILAIVFYQKLISIVLKNILGVNVFCRFETTCSQYAKSSIEKYGLFRGSIMSAKRLMLCQPFYKNERFV